MAECAEVSGRQTWTASEEGFLQENYFFMSAPDIAAKLGKSVPAVKGKISRFRLWGCKRAPGWTPELDAVVRSRYPEEGPTAIASKIGRTEAAVRARARVLGVQFRPRRPWASDEVSRLRELAPGKTLAELARLLGRPMQSVQSKLQELELQPLPPSQMPRVWTPEQDAELRDLYGKGLAFADIGSALGRTPGACQQRAFKLRLKRDRAVRPAPKARPSKKPSSKLSKDKASKQSASVPAPSSKPEPKPAPVVAVKDKVPACQDPAAEQPAVDGLDLSSMSKMELLRHLVGVEYSERR